MASGEGIGLKVDAIIFDVDGVLLDTSGSYTAAAVEAVSVATGSDRFTTHEASRLKAVKGFNNDWHVAIAGAAWVEFTDRLPFQVFARKIEQAGGGLAGLRLAVGRALTAKFETRLTRLAQESYGGTSACHRLYGFEPETIRQVGRWQTEVPLLAPQLAEPMISRIGIVTGRSRAEMEQGFQLLGWQPPPEQVAVADDPAFDKTNPVKLVAMLSHMQSRKALFVGDTRDDLELVINAQQSDGRELDFGYVGPFPCPWPEVEIMAPKVTDLLESIEVTYDDV